MYLDVELQKEYKLLKDIMIYTHAVSCDAILEITYCNPQTFSDKEKRKPEKNIVENPHFRYGKSRETKKGINMIKVYYMVVWKYHDETPKYVQFNICQ